MPNFTPETATIITTLPFVEVVDSQGAPTGVGFSPSCTSVQYHALWWVYTAGPNDVVLSVGAEPTASANYAPTVDIWIGTLPALVEYAPVVSETPTPLCQDTTGGFAFNMPVTPGVTYYIQVTDSNADEPLGALVTLTVLTAGVPASPLGSLFVLNDNPGWPAWSLDATTGALLRAFTLPATEQAGFIPTGVVAMWEEAPLTNLVIALKLFDTTLSLIHTVTSLIVANQDPIGPITTDGVDTFYVAIRDNTSHAVIHTLDSSGVIGGTSWTLPSNSIRISGMAVSPDELTLYYVTEVDGDGVHRYDLGGDAPLSDLLAGAVGTTHGRDVLVLSTGDILVMSRPGTTANVKRYNPAGVFQLNYPNIPDSQSSPRMALELDNPVSFRVMGFPANFTGHPVSRFMRFVVADATVTAFDVDQVNAGESIQGTPFGPSQSCPLLLLPVEVPEPPECVPVTISSQPNSPTIEAGQSATLTVTAVGTEPIFYQWYQGVSGDTSHPVIGAIDATFVTPVLTVTTSYWVLVSNPCGLEDSLGATVTVPAPPDPPTIPPSRTLLFDIKAQRWFADAYPSATLVRLWEPGAGVHDQILGHQDGTVDVFAGHQDQGADIPYIFEPPDVDAGDPRRDKLYGDAFVSADPKGGPGFIVIPGYNDYQTLLTTQLLGAGLSGRQPIVLDINGGDGQLARNFGITITGSDSVGPVFYIWEPSFVQKVEVTEGRSTDWENCGMDGAKFLQGVIFQASTEGQDKRVVVQYGTQFSEVITINDTIESQVPYSFLNPFVAHLVRIVSVDETPWHYYGAIWRFQPFPESVSVFQTPPTTKDFPGYSQDERALIGHISTVDFDLVVIAGDKTFTYRIPNSNGVYQKTPILFAPNKALWYSYACRVVGGSQTLRLFLQDCEIRSRAWGSPSGYAPLRIFGEQSREGSAARI